LDPFFIIPLPLRTNLQFFLETSNFGLRSPHVPLIFWSFYPDWYFSVLYKISVRLDPNFLHSFFLLGVEYLCQEPSFVIPSLSLISLLQIPASSTSSRYGKHRWKGECKTSPLDELLAIAYPSIKQLYLLITEANSAICANVDNHLQGKALLFESSEKPFEFHPRLMPSWSREK